MNQIPTSPSRDLVQLSMLPEESIRTSPPHENWCCPRLARVHVSIGLFEQIVSGMKVTVAFPLGVGRGVLRMGLTRRGTQWTVHNFVHHPEQSPLAAMRGANTPYNESCVAGWCCNSHQATAIWYQIDSLRSPTLGWPRCTRNFGGRRKFLR